MFSDSRSRKVVFTVHCILNQNSISDGTADFPGLNKELLQVLMDSGAGIVQMPCPELCCLGLDRGNIYGAESPVIVENTGIRREMKKPEARKKMLALVEQVMYQIRQYQLHGFEILCIIGSNRSPCCGVDTTSDNNEETAGRGVFIAELMRAMEAEGINIPVIGIKAGGRYAEKLKGFLQG